MKIENREKFLFIVVLVILGLIVCNWLVFTPLTNWWKVREAKIIQLRHDVGEGKYLIQREAKIRGDWENMRTNALPSNISLAEQQLFKAFDNWAQQSGASLVGIMPQWKNDSTNYMTLNCRVEASGNISTLGAFLYKIEKGPMALKLDSVEVSTHDNTGQQLTLGMQVSALSLLSANPK
jgi:Tfp pilus assembly protein PilO